MTGRTKAVYTCFALENVAPKVEVDIFVSTIDCLTIFSCVFRKCGLRFSLVSICKSKNLMSDFGLIIVASLLVVTALFDQIPIETSMINPEIFLFCLVTFSFLPKNSKDIEIRVFVPGCVSLACVSADLV